MGDTFNAELVYNLMRDYNGGKDLFTTPYADFVPTKDTIPPKPFNDGQPKTIHTYENHAVKVDVKPMPGLFLNTVDFGNADYEEAVRAIDRTNEGFFRGFDFAYDALAEERYERKRKALMESEALLNYAKERDDWREQERRIAFTEYGITPDEYEAMIAKEKVESAVKLHKEGRRNVMGIKAKLTEVVEESRRDLQDKKTQTTVKKMVEKATGMPVKTMVETATETERVVVSEPPKAVGRPKGLSANEILTRLATGENIASEEYGLGTLKEIVKDKKLGIMANIYDKDSKEALLNAIKGRLSED